MTEDTWNNRDLPVLKAAVELYEEKGRGPRVSAVEERTGFDPDTVQRALRALYSEPYFEEVRMASGAGRIHHGRQADQRRATSRWTVADSRGAARTHGRRAGSRSER